MPCIFFRDGVCKNPNRNFDFDCTYELLADCPEGVGDHMINVQTSVLSNTPTRVTITKINYVGEQ